MAAGRSSPMGSEIDLCAKARWVRQQILEMAVRAGGGHIAPSLSCVELLVALYQGEVLHVNPERPHWQYRDRFILSKGHASLALHAVLADMGYFPLDWLERWGLPGGELGGMAEPTVPGIEMSSGALGHGLSVGAGMAFAARTDRLSYRTYVLLGDGECQEGGVWEAAEFCSHHNLEITAIVDRNQLQALDSTEFTLRLEPLAHRWRSFGWRVLEINGHDIDRAIGVLRATRPGPHVVIAHTVKGRGISFMEHKPIWHYRVPEGKELEVARRQLA